MYIEFTKIYQSDKTIMEVENGVIVRLLLPEELPQGVSVRRISGYAYPGFNDSHMHLVGLGKKLSSVDCTGCTTREEMTRRVEEFMRGPGGSSRRMITGRGWNQDLFTDKKLPTQEDLNRVSSEIPIVIHRVCGHIAVCNRAALRSCGLLVADGSIDLDMVDRLRKTGGEVDIEDGQLTGILREFACDILKERYGREDLERFILLAQEYLLSLGITSVQTDDCYFTEDWRDMIRIFREMEADGRLKIRVYEQSQIKSGEELLNEYMQEKTPTAHLGSGAHLEAGAHFEAAARIPRFRLGPLKILSDGSLGARTAYMTVPYADDPSTRGILAVSEETLRHLMLSANRSGTDSAIHGIGDGAIEILLRINEQSQMRSSEHRNTIIHCQVMSGEQIDRMAKLRLGAMVQPIFLEYDLKIIRNRVGTEKAETSYAYRTMLDKGIRLAFGSDAPVENPDPLLGMHYAVNRDSEAISLEEAIRAYTEEGAYFSYEESFKGKLLEGYVADIAVFEHEIDTSNLKRNKNIATLIAGELLYSVY